MKRNAIIIPLFALLILAACGRKFEQPLDGQWYRTSYKGQTYFLKTDGNSVLVYSDSIPETIRYNIRGKRVIIERDGREQRDGIRTQEREIALNNEEPPYAERHVRWCERSENKSRRKLLLFSSYSIAG